MVMKMFLMLLFLGLGVSAQEMIIEIEDFNEVEVDSGLKVNFLKSEENKAVVSGSMGEDVRIYNENGKLFVSSRVRKIIKEENAVVNIYYRDLRSVEATQNSDVELCGEIKQAEITLEAREGANLFADLNVEILKASAVTGGHLNLMGSAENQDIEVRSEGMFRGEILVGEHIKVAIQGGGNANVNAVYSVEAKVEAGGNVNIYGDPEKIVKNSGIAGRIQKIN